MNNDGNPDCGTDPDWTLLTTVAAPGASGYLTASDTPLLPYDVNYVATHDCTPPIPCPALAGN